MSCSSMQLQHRGVGKKKSAYPSYSLQYLSPHGVASRCLPQAAAPCSSGCCHANSAGCSPLPQSLLRTIVQLSGSKHRQELQPSMHSAPTQSRVCSSMHAGHTLGCKSCSKISCMHCLAQAGSVQWQGAKLPDRGPMVRVWAPGRSPCGATASPPAGSPHASCPGQAPGGGAQRPGRAGRAAL